jgi:ankyrin repeat protein
MANLFDLLAQGRVSELRDVLAQDPAAARTRNPAGASLLVQAAYMGSAEVVAAVREVLADLDPYESIILGEADGVRAALAGGWDANEYSPDGFSALGLAAFFQRIEIFDLLLPVTRDVNQRAKNTQQVAALHAATAVREAGMVERLLLNGANPNLPQQDGFLPIHASAQHGDAVITGLLVLFGASPALANSTGKNAIDHAREGGHDWLAELLERLA